MANLWTTLHTALENILSEPLIRLVYESTTTCLLEHVVQSLTEIVAIQTTTGWTSHDMTSPFFAMRGLSAIDDEDPEDAIDPVTRRKKPRPTLQVEQLPRWKQALEEPFLWCRQVVIESVPDTSAINVQSLDEAYEEQGTSWHVPN